MNWRLEANSTAYSALVRNAATSSDVIVGRISTQTTYTARSPRTLAASRKSLLRTLRACERSWRAVYDQPVSVSTVISTSVPEFCT